MAEDVVTVPAVELTFAEARALEQFLRRAALADFLKQADSRAEAMQMLSAAAKFGAALDGAR